MATNGRIDVHAHPIPDFYREALIAAGRGPSIAGGFPAWTPSLAQEQMDEHDISAALLSVSQPGVNFGDDAVARKLARSFNEFLAKLSSKSFGGFAVLPLPDIAGSCAEIDFALGQLGLDGVGIFASYGDMFLGDERLAHGLDDLSRLFPAHRREAHPVQHLRRSGLFATWRHRRHRAGRAFRRRIRRPS